MTSKELNNQDNRNDLRHFKYYLFKIALLMT
jgi:hypothetical protein